MPETWMYYMNGVVTVHIRESGITRTPSMGYNSANALYKKMNKQLLNGENVTFFNDELVEMSVNPEYIVSIDLDTV